MATEDKLANHSVQILKHERANFLYMRILINFEFCTLIWYLYIYIPLLWKHLLLDNIEILKLNTFFTKEISQLLQAGLVWVNCVEQLPLKQMLSLTHQSSIFCIFFIVGFFSAQAVKQIRESQNAVHSLEDIYHEFCDKKIRDSLSCFLPQLPGKVWYKHFNSKAYSLGYIAKNPGGLNLLGTIIAI